MDIESLIETRPLIILCGLGGAGKTSLSAALGLKAAEMGKKTLVMTVDPAKRLAQAMGLKKTKAGLQKVPLPDISGSLSVSMLDPKRIFDEVISRYAPSEKTRDTILANPLYQHLSTILAGSQEYMAMEKLFEYVDSGQFATLVVDTPPARHAIDFLEAPLKLTHALNDSLLQYILMPSVQMGKIGAKLLGAFSKITGEGLLQDIATLFGSSLQMMDGFVKRAGVVQELLRKPSTAFLLAVSGRQLSLQDSLEFIREIQELGFHFEGSLINRMPTLPPQGTPPIPAAKILSDKQVRRKQAIEERMAPLIALSDYHPWIPELPEAVNKLEGLEVLAKFLT